ncbi:hypothetical protein BDM02DRAFT_3190998 [Thelephora ganbajun]|uniref:Uncharacterized protein n=1 Tax=Thelephora ganbajun TaxID=370292 RepID=A0ACB6Z3Y0_THEGA|nr:hypothetical protein BDM02DRAFT_3190998 [Thelephora ganbajun]
MTLENNCTFISPCHQKITHINTRPHCKDGKGTDDAYGFEYPTMTSLVDAVISQEDNEFPHHQYTSGCSFDDIVWQQAIGALKNQDHSRCGRSMADDEKVLFDLVQQGFVDHEVFDQPHKFSTRGIHYLAVVANHLWSLYKVEHIRNDRLEAKLNTLKGEVQLLSSCCQDCTVFG